MKFRQFVAVAAALLIAPALMAQTTFTVTLGLKTSAHPYFGMGQVRAFFIDGTEANELTLVRGKTYIFQMSGVPAGHSFYISTDAAGGGAGEWLDGVTGSGASGNGTLTIAVPSNAPDLFYYQCFIHEYMGWKINIINPTVSTSVFDGPGWRLLSAPVTGMTVGDLAAINLVQGIPGQYPPPQADPNIFTSYLGGGVYTPPAGEADAVDPGYGFYWYWYDTDNTPPSGGTSVGHELSAFTLSAEDVPNTADVANTHPQNAPGVNNPFPNPQNASGGGGSEFYLAGNPFADPLEADGITSANVTLSSVFSAWDPSVPGYVSISGAGTFVAPWQGLFAEVTINAGVNPVIDYAFASVDPVETPPFYGRHASSDNQYVSLSLSGETDSGVAVGDRAAMVRFLDDAEVGFERQDGSKLYPPTAMYAMLSPVGERFGAPYHLAVNSLPTLEPDATEVIEVPVAFIATDASDLEITWEGADALPEEWTVHLRDTESGALVDLAVETSFGFSAEATGWVDRFVLVFTPAGVVANEGGSGLPTTFALTGAYPNPFNPSTTVRFDVPESANVRLEVFDMLGRQVSLLADGPIEAGSHSIRWDAADVASGVYLVRMQAGDFTQAQRVTLLK